MLLCNRASSRLSPVTPHAGTQRTHVRRVRLRAQNSEQQPSTQGQPTQQQQQQPAAASRDSPSTITSSTPSTTSSSLRAETEPPYRGMAVLAAAGAVETAYLTITKLTAAATACPTNGCASVLESPYGTLFGLPLPLFGFAAYGTVAAAAWAASDKQASGRPVPELLSAGVAAGCGALATTSAVLMYILHTALGGAPCVWCYASAGLSFGLALLLVTTLDRRHMMEAAGPSLTATAAAALTLYMGFGQVPNSTAAADFELPFVAPVVTTDSSESAVSLARRLKDAGAKMYGAFWCTHCFDQKQAFGKQAMGDFPYVECYPEGWKRGVDVAPACKEADIKAFPTWVINGAVTEGELDLEQVEAALQATAAPSAADGNTAGAAAGQGELAAVAAGGSAAAVP